MASFDPIEYFGVGHGRDIAVVRQARTPSQTSISLSDGEPATQDHPEWTQHAAPPLRGIAKEPPWPPLPSFGHITPENSVSGRVNPPSSAVSPDVSSHGGVSMSDPAHPHSLGRYVHDVERHEQIAMSFHYPPGTGGHPEPVASYRNHHPSQDYTHAPKHQQYPNSDAPINRYLTDLLAYEQLAMALRAEQEGYNPHDHPDMYEYAMPEGVSLSISNGPDFDEEDRSRCTSPTLLTLLADMSRCADRPSRNERQRREQPAAAGQPRLFKVQMGRSRKRYAEASQPLAGHKDKMVKRF
ncbi:hypothetical protein C8A05DRAFT_17021 [Staphylotrichum tortipilum]|uniref:Uncharacterized protein n=1 Tax=Staphylotrichum tortipilum TaxID=2831512 RepID=A0AAN6MH07_9PEZI|nr:hypothetical protein C8A05DRAFT_17021 [Staphylotrichum longicolle]